MLFASTVADAFQGGRAGGLPGNCHGDPCRHRRHQRRRRRCGDEPTGRRGHRRAGVHERRPADPHASTHRHRCQGTLPLSRSCAIHAVYLRAARLGYASTRYGAAGPAVPTTLPELEIRTIDDIATIAVAADQWVSDVRIRFGASAASVGASSTSAMNPWSARPCKRSARRSPRGIRSTPAPTSRTTDDRGEYRLANLAPGKYAVSVLSVQATVLASRPEGMQQRALESCRKGHRGSSSGDGLPSIGSDARHRLALSNYATPPPPGGGRPQAYAATFYPATSAIGMAEAIEIGPGTIRRGVDFQLRPVETVTVSGGVETPVGTGSPNEPPLLLRLMPVGRESLGVGSEAATTFVDPDGIVHVPQCPAGRLHASRAGLIDRVLGRRRAGDVAGTTRIVGKVCVAWLDGDSGTRVRANTTAPCRTSGAESPSRWATATCAASCCPCVPRWPCAGASSWPPMRAATPLAHGDRGARERRRGARQQASVHIGPRTGHLCLGRARRGQVSDWPALRRPNLVSR